MVTPCVCTPGSLGAMPVCIMLSSRRISASTSLTCDPQSSTGTPKPSPNFPHTLSSPSQPIPYRSNSRPISLYSSAKCPGVPQRQVATHLSGSRLDNRLACLCLLTHLFLFGPLYLAIS